MSTYSETITWPWVVFRNVLTVGFSAVGGGLLWPATVYGWPLAAIIWAVVVVVVQALLIRFQRQPWLGLSFLARVGFTNVATDVQTPRRWSTYPRYLMILDDALPLLLLGWALHGGVTRNVGLVHHVLMGCLVTLIGCSLYAKSRSGHDEEAEDHQENM